MLSFFHQSFKRRIVPEHDLASDQGQQTTGQMLNQSATAFV